ncbi:MAG TPA: hypothetical protein VHG91_09345 [Longimicrobium sp.]|nr:hypothetical protein [Longimicrobium sp.]
MSLADTPQWERLDGHYDFRQRLRELSRRDERRLFHPLDAGSYVVSIQASCEHASVPARAVPAAEVEAWEVAVFAEDGRLLEETRDPELIALPREWLRYWSGGVARRVPTAVVRVLLDRFALGPEHFDRFVLEGCDPE